MVITDFLIRNKPRHTAFDQRRQLRWEKNILEVSERLHLAIRSRIDAIMMAILKSDDHLRSRTDLASTDLEEMANQASINEIENDQKDRLKNIALDLATTMKLLSEKSVTPLYAYDCLVSLTGRVAWVIRELKYNEQVRIAALHPSVASPGQPPVEVVEISSGPEWITKVDRKRKRSTPISDPHSEQEQEEQEISLAQEWNLWDTQSEEFPEGSTDSEAHLNLWHKSDNPAGHDSDQNYKVTRYTPPVQPDPDSEEDIEVAPKTPPLPTDPDCDSEEDIEVTRVQKKIKIE